MDGEGCHWGHLMADLHALVDAGVLIEILERGEPSRYALTRSAGQATSTSGSSAQAYRLPDWPEPCPVCRATDGFDGGGRCLVCHVAWPPEM